jgi:Dolichyl-phosphate-mannose-protein mannosyltransferase
MADAINWQPSDTPRHKLLPLLGGVGVAVVALWLTADQEVVALVSPHDDQFFMERAACGYWFDQGYTHFSFIKEPIYPLFVWIVCRLGINLRLATTAVYLAAACFFSWSLVRHRTHSVVGFLVFAACALHPMQFTVFRQTTPDALYPTLLLLSLGSLFIQFQASGQHGRWWHGLLTGLALGLLWNTRPERPLTILLLLFFLVAGACKAWHQEPTRKAAFGRWLRIWGPTPVVLALAALMILTANYVRFGVFATTDLRAPGYWLAYQALTGIRGEHSMRFVPMTREARLQAYAVSPSFRELQPYLEGSIGEHYASFGREFYDLPPGEIAGGWFCWALRDAAAAAGHCGSAEEAEAFYGQIVREIEIAVRAGMLDKPVMLPYGVDPSYENYLPYLPASAAKLWQMCWSSNEPPPLTDHAHDVRQLFDAVAHRRPIQPSATAQYYIRSWLWWMYGPVLQGVLFAGALLAALVLGHRRPGRGWYLFVALAICLAGWSRFGLFALIDASAFPGDRIRYLFPAAVLLSALAVWLVGEGIRVYRDIPAAVP